MENDGSGLFASLRYASVDPKTYSHREALARDVMKLFKSEIRETAGLAKAAAERDRNLSTEPN